MSLRAWLRLTGWLGMVTSVGLMLTDVRSVPRYSVAYVLFLTLVLIGQERSPHGRPEVPEVTPVCPGSAGQGLAPVLSWIDGVGQRDSGAWRRGEEVELVRWDPVIGAYLYNGIVWMDSAALSIQLADLECRGYVPDDDPFTCAIREALGLPGWWEMLNEA